MQHTAAQKVRGVVFFLFALFAPNLFEHCIALIYHQHGARALLLYSVVVTAFVVLRPSYAALSAAFLWISLWFLAMPLAWETKAPANITFGELHYYSPIYAGSCGLALVCSIVCLVMHFLTRPPRAEINGSTTRE